MPSKFFILILFLFTSKLTTAQYYYKDIISNSNTTEELAGYKKAGIHLIKIKSFEVDGTLTEDFFCEKKLTKDYKKATLKTKSAESGKSMMESFFNADNQIQKTYDSAETYVNTNFFNYNAQKKLTGTKSISISFDDDFMNKNTEEHLYTYDEQNRLLKMLLIKDNKDTTIILFSNDEKGNTAIEKNAKTGFKYYYYYDENNRLTDIVHSNNLSEKMRADYIFEYNENGQLDKLITTGDANSLIWKYDYDNGVRIKERFFNSSKKYLGKIEYEYK